MQIVADGLRVRPTLGLRWRRCRAIEDRNVYGRPGPGESIPAMAAVIIGSRSGLRGSAGELPRTPESQKPACAGLRLPFGEEQL